MRVLATVFLCSLTVLCTWMLNQRFESYPPLGKLLNPASGFWANTEMERISAPSELKIEGLSAPVTVYWDENLIPHISAQTSRDLYIVQGYVTAFHRLWQMEFQLFKTEGRLSEVLGTVTAKYDQRQRRKGLRYAAEEMWKEVSKDPKTRSMLEAYSEGVNAYINTLSYRDYPIEYKLLDYKPGAWSPYKSCLLIKEMGDILSLDDRDIENSNLIQQLGQETFDLLFSEQYPQQSYVIPSGTSFNFEPLPLPSASHDTLALRLPPRKKGPSPHHGSNTVVIGPGKSRDSLVLFSCSPDLDLNLPSTWYLNHLIEPEGQVMGGTIPGLPGVVIGFNDSIAWGLANAERDLSDWYEVRFTDTSRQEYYYNNDEYKTKIRVETIYVRDQKPIYDTVVYTHHGPVVYDRNFSEGLSSSLNLARRWSGYYPSNEFAMIYYVNRARNYEDFRKAIAHLKTPSQNISFASASGDIAIHEQGYYPLKWIGQGKFVMDGSKSVNDWYMPIPNEHVLWAKNPAQGFLSAANQYPVDHTYPYYIYSYNFEHFRGRRLDERLQSMENIRSKDLIRLQNDNFNYIAYESLPLMLDSLDRRLLSVEESQVYGILSRWDYFNDANLTAPTYFETWFDLLVESIWDEIHLLPNPKYEPSIYHTIQLMRNHPTLSFYDRVSTSKRETLGTLIADTFKKSVTRLIDWKEAHHQSPTWAKVRGTEIRHLLRLEPFGVYDVPTGGNHNIINAIKGNHGPTLRIVVAFSKGQAQAWAIYPGSQVGNPGHTAYAEWITRWAEADYLSLLFSKDQNVLRKKSILTQTFHPYATDR